MSQCKECGQDIPEKSLEEKFQALYRKVPEYNFNEEQLAQIASDHFKAKFDEATQNNMRINYIDVVRKSIFRENA